MPSPPTRSGASVRCAGGAAAAGPRATHSRRLTHGTPTIRARQHAESDGIYVFFVPEILPEKFFCVLLFFEIKTRPFSLSVCLVCVFETAGCASPHHPPTKGSKARPFGGASLRGRARP